MIIPGEGDSNHPLTQKTYTILPNFDNHIQFKNLITLAIRKLSFNLIPWLFFRKQ